MLTNNDIFKKLRVALELRDDDIIKILKLVNFEISKTELSAIFRNEDHPNYKPCGDQLLRNFLNGLVIYKRHKDSMCLSLLFIKTPRVQFNWQRMANHPANIT